MSRFMNMAKLAADLGVTPAQLAVSVQNAFTPGNPSGLSGAMGFTVDIFEQVRAGAVDVKLPEILWSKVLPGASLDTSVNVGAKLTSYRVRDRRGKGAFRAAVGKDIPTVGVTMNKVTIPLESAAVSASIDLDDIRAVAFGHEGMNLITDNGAVMREASERHIEHVFFYGFQSLGFAGWLDYSLTPITTAGAKAAGGTTWAVATPDEIIADVQNWIGTAMTNSKMVFKPGRLSLPVAQWVKITSTRINGTGGNGVNQTIAEFLAKNNAYTAATGRDLEIVPIRYLEGAGVGGTNRAILEDTDPENFYMPMSEVFNMLPPQDAALATNLFATYKFGSFHRPFPTAALQADGI